MSGFIKEIKVPIAPSLINSSADFLSSPDNDFTYLSNRFSTFVFRFLAFHIATISNKYEY